MLNWTCNSTIDELRIIEGSERIIVGSYNFHDLAVLVGGVSAAFAIVVSLYLITMHAVNYTKPVEQKHIIRILFMVPVYSTASWLSIRYYWHSIYFSVMSECYEAFAISSFFALLCAYIAPDLHDQKQYFRYMTPIKPWVMPVNWFARCCGGQRGPWRMPRGGLTWFNIVWIGIYHYCFIRIAMTVTAVVTQYYSRYCESSNSPAFAHIWVLIIESVAVSIAMYCVVQFYVQLKEPLADYSPFLKVLAIKLVIFLSFWQSTMISIGTSTMSSLQGNDVLAYPDIKVVIPALLLCVEMACFSVMHIWAFSYRPYLANSRPTFYPVPDPSAGVTPKENEHGPHQGGPLGLLALWDAANVWDVAKAFARGLRWLFVGVRRRHDEASYSSDDPSYMYKSSAFSPDPSPMVSPRKDPGLSPTSRDFDGDTAYHGGREEAVRGAGKSTDHLPIASEFRRSQYGPTKDAVNAERYGGGGGPRTSRRYDERQGLMAHAQPDPSSRGGHVDNVDHETNMAEQEQMGAVALAGMIPPSYYYGDRNHSLSTVVEESPAPSRITSHYATDSASGSIPIGVSLTAPPTPELLSRQGSPQLYQHPYNRQPYRQHPSQPPPQHPPQHPPQYPPQQGRPLYRDAAQSQVAQALWGPPRAGRSVLGPGVPKDWQ